MRFKLTPHQQAFCGDVSSNFLSIIGGFGSGKTHAFCVKSIILAGLNAGYEGALAEPTNYLVRTRLVPAMLALLEEHRIPYDYEKSDQIFRLHFREGTTTIYCLSGENWERLVGYNLAFFGSDETDTSNQDIAEAMWLKAISRVRWGPVRQIFSTSTPEGYKFLHSFFVEKPRQLGTLEVLTGEAPGVEGSYVREHKGTLLMGDSHFTTRAIHATSYENPLLDLSYINSMKANYTLQQWKVWALGQFGTLFSQLVYPYFNREKNHTNREVTTFSRFEPLHVGMDFNVGKMAAVCAFIDGRDCLVIDEITGLADTRAMIAEIRKRYPQRPILVYPDASGKNRSVTGVDTSHSMLREAGFKVVVDPSNPLVGDRVNSVNARFLSAADQRHLFLNTARCPVLTRCLEQQLWVNGEPDKKSDLDHPPDALGYLVHKNWPLTGRPTLRSS